MKPSIALEKNREAVREAFQRYPTIANPRVFGSVLHGDDTDESDLDLLVDIFPGTTLFTLGGLEFELEQLLGIPVQVLSAEELPVQYRSNVVAEAAPL